jgi:hypothetical protein
MRYGLEGYGLYWYLLERIVDNIETHNLTFELEDDAEIISHDTGIHVDQVQEVMKYMVSLNLFELSNSNVITCLKLAKRLDQSMTSNPAMRAKISKIKEIIPDKIMTASCHSHDSIMQEEKRREENTCSSDDERERFEQFWKAYPRKTGKQDALKAWKQTKPSGKLVDTIAKDLIARMEADQWRDKQYIPQAGKYLRQRIWEDEVIISRKKEEIPEGIDWDGVEC